MTAEECLVTDNHLKEGLIEVTVIGIEQRAGKIIEKLENKKVRPTIDISIEDISVLQPYGELLYAR